MKNSILTIFIFAPFLVHAQIITTIASTTGSAIYDPQQLAFDKKGNFYFQTGDKKVIKVDTAYVISIFAGTGSSGFSGDSSLATSAKINGGAGITTDSSGNVYIADAGNNRIRKIDISTGVITTIAGNGIAGYGGDSAAAILATLNLPNGLCFDKYGDLFIADDANHRIRKIDTLGIISTFVGNGLGVSTGNGGPATAAGCGPTYSMTFDDFGNFYFIDGTSHTIRKVDTFGIINLFAGNGIGGYNGDGIPATSAAMEPISIAFDIYRQLCISDWENNRVRIIDSSGNIHTLVGNGLMGSTGDGGLADTAEINSTSGIAFDHCGNLYIAQVNQPCIRKVSFNPYCWPQEVPQVNENKITIYPNPCKDELSIDGIGSGSEYMLLNILGIMKQTGVLDHEHNIIATNFLPPGLYILKIYSSSGAYDVKRFIKN